MADVVGVRFKKTGKIYYFDPSGIELKIGDCVVEESEALDECAKRITQLKLPMKLISAEYNLDASRLTIFFSAESRVDFRELVREMSRFLRVRIEMRQVGPRDEAKLLGGFGRCGRPLCCASFLSEFSPVSIKMAKEQDLPLNPMKISGLCGRLLCCLGYEFEQYRAMKEKMPREGKRISTAMGEATVVGGNPLEGTVLVELESGARVELSIDEITSVGKETIGQKRSDSKKQSNRKKGLVQERK